MSDRMTPVPFGSLMNWILTEHEQGSVFGVQRPFAAPGKALDLFGEHIETPFGPAAGPHTQLAQNIISAYYAGSRFFELKTVQTLDGEDLPVSKPCILAEDECYNVEWSTELRVEEAFNEYVKAWYAMKLLSAELSLGAPDGFVFNMSVGYDLAGIQTAKIDGYISAMRDASQSAVWQECQAWALDHLARFSQVDAAYIKGISPRVSDSITLSTLHGCPPEEIERLAVYLIRDKGLHTFIKCNPTLLGFDFARKTLDAMGFGDLAFDDHHFKDDLQYADAVPMLKRLQRLAEDKGVTFGVKLTNTMPVDIAQGQLPGAEMYMSGKSLFPLSIALAAKLEKDFDGKLRVSFSGGADAFNISEIVSCGVWPVTMATTALKPGGYGRFKQIAEEMGKLDYAPFAGVDVQRLAALADSATRDPHHRKPAKEDARPRMDGKAPLLDCFAANCRETCPIHQDIPAYLALVEQGKYVEALEVICRKNPLPFTTGTICSHRCQSACTRRFYEESVHIRESKLLAAQRGIEAYLKTLAPAIKANAPSVAVVGGGPAGMAAAFLAARAGAKVTLFEKRDSLGGIPRHVIPAFRIPDSAIDSDIRLLNAMGVTVRLNAKIKSLDDVKAFDHTLVAVGAWKHTPLALDEGDSLNVLDFLERAKKAPDALNGKGHIIVVGGGNTAMDAARAAKRLPGATDVTIVYRRQVRQMPADLEELELAMAEGVAFKELLAPKALRGGKLLCQVMRLGAPGPDGRRKPEPTGDTIELPADTVIAAIGEKPDEELLAAFGNKARLIGDARHGPATVVEAIADAAEAVNAIWGEMADADTANTSNNGKAPQTAALPQAALLARRGVLKDCDGTCDSARCLHCDAICENCVDVCPNRANVAVAVNGGAQVLHVDRLCNECGNCAAFCPYQGEPYHDKWTLFSTLEDFDKSEGNQGFLPLGNGLYRVRLNGQVFDAPLNEGALPGELAEFIRCAMAQRAYLL